MKPFYHDNIMAKKFGGIPDDYSEINDFFDSSKSTLADVRHRAILHNTFGIYLAEKVFGRVITNSDGKEVSVRDIAEEHVLQDLGFIPTVEHWLSNMSIKAWMGGQAKKNKTLSPESHEDFVVDGAMLYRKTLTMETKDAD